LNVTKGTEKLKYVKYRILTPSVQTLSGCFMLAKAKTEEG
jgi:hypothetical protein